MPSKSEEVKKLEPIFTPYPAELKGEIINVGIKKDPTFGIFIFGMNGICVENEFIQVTEVVPESPAHICGVLPGDIIVYIKQECVLGTWREDVLTLLDSFSVGDTVNFQLCRGYALQETMDSRIYIVRGRDPTNLFSSATRGGAWHYVLVDKDKKEDFQENIETGNLDVADYGRILCSGWGEYPPQDVKVKMNEEYGAKIEIHSHS
uniref:PDZ domain-containing protein n=1 Tax=Meloidogyne incognita TaxID=6306 RepID=A0A914M354_MELIC